MDRSAADMVADGVSRGSFLVALGLRMLDPDGDASRATALLGPGTWAKGTQRPRLGALATMVDVVAGLRPARTLWPTVDMTVQLIAPLPAHGEIELISHPLKTGRRLFVGEVIVRHGETPVARAVTTFLNQSYAGQAGEDGQAGRRRPHAAPRPAAIPFDDWLNPEYTAERTTLIERTPPIMNGSGTIQGGALATAAELAAEHALAPSGAFATTELDIRYLGPVLAGPLAATADVLAVHDDRAFVSVRLTDAGADDRIVAYATTVCAPA